MKRGRRRAGSSCPPFHLLMVSSLAALAVCTAASAAAAAAAPFPPAGGLEQTAFMSSPSGFGADWQGRQRQGSGRAAQAVQSKPGSSGGGEASRDRRVAVHDDSWYLGDGGFAARHMEDEVRLAAKKEEKDFFRQRDLSVYDQMKEASMLLLAQQQLLAAEEAREEASKPRFVAKGKGTMAARAQAARDRQKRRDAGAGLLPDAPVAVAAAAAAGAPCESASASTSGLAFPKPASRASAGKKAQAEGEAAVEGGVGGGAAPLLVPVGPGSLSGESLGVGGLDEELEEIRRRVCVPLAAPPELLEDLGISPVRGMLLYGPPGCGKTLLARRLSAALTRRPPAVVSGPEILERFVGSSEANIRALFDYPPDVPGGDDQEQEEALHVIVMDEFDSIGQRRGGGDDGGDRVRDSVVNQLLARMDGFQELERPTLLVALTNRIDLLDTALLRPGRFEVQVHIPGPDEAGREAILRIHTQRMHEAGRIDTPPPDANRKSGGGVIDADGYDSLVSSLAAVTDGFSGAELAGLVRAAASYALERAVGGGAGASEAAGCRVTAEDFGRGLADVTRSKSSAGTAAGGRAANGTAVAATTAVEERQTAAVDDVSSDGSAAAAAEGPREDGEKAAASRQQKAPFTVTKPSVAAATVAAARAEGAVGGNLSAQDLESVQKLLLEKTSKREEEGVLLFDAAQVVAQRRKGAVRGGGGAGFSPGMGKRGASVAAAAAGEGEYSDEEQREDGGVESSADRPRREQFTMSPLESEDDKCMYSFGVSLAIDTDQFRKLLTIEERRTSLQGFSDHWLEMGMQLDHSHYTEEVNEILQSRNEQLEEYMAAEAEGFLASAAAEEGAVQTYSGMVVKTIREGSGAVPLPTDTVKVHYHGTLIDRSVFDSSITRGDPVSFPLDGVIKGWAEGLQLMRVGGKSKLTIPPDLAYGEMGSGPIPADATLVFEVELLAIEC